MTEPTGPSGQWTALLPALFDAAPVGLAVWDSEFRCVGMNATLAQASAESATSEVGRTAGELLGGLGRKVEEVLREVAASREPVVEAPVAAPTPGRPETESLWRLTCYPLSAPRDGKVTGWATALVDVGRSGQDTATSPATEEHFRLLVESVADYAIIMLDADGHVTSWNTGAQRITGYHSEEIIGEHVSRFHPAGEEPQEEPERLLRAAGDRGRVATENWRVRKDGSRFWAGVALTALYWPSGKVRGFAKVVRDLTEQRQADEALRVRETTLRSVLQSAPDAVIVVDQEGKVSSINTRGEQMFGYTADELVGQPIEVLVPERLRDVHVRYRNDFLGAPQARPMGGGLDLTARRRDGSEFPVEVGLGPAEVSHTRGTLVTVVVTDITRRKQAEEELAHQATHDTLTGLPNRALFGDRLEQALHRTVRRGGAAHTVAVLFFDLDRFKVINDSLGHEAGDRVLAAVADRLRGLSRPTDTVARFGGDEFAMLCEGLSGPRDAARIAERALDRLAVPLEVAQGEHSLTASIGIALADRPLGDMTSLLRDADTALYRAKQQGRSRYELFNAELRQQATDRVRLENELRRAVEHEQLCLLYQPVVHMATRRIVGVEALVRWKHPERGLIPPGEFIRVAEETGLIAPLGEWVLQRACRQAVRWRRDLIGEAPFRISVNFSTHQFAKTDAGDTIRRTLDQEGLEPGSLQLDITESALTTDLPASEATLHDLSALGVHFAIDDYGTGYSSLSRLRHLPVDVLKVGPDFVAGLGRVHADSALVDAVVGIARSYGLAFVAEGVETAGQESVLRELGCEYAQGHHYAEPAPASTIEGLLRSSPPSATRP